MQTWTSVHAKLSEKKLKKLEKTYKQLKEEEALKDPLVKYQKECKELTLLLRRLEQENDDLANEYIDSKATLSRQLDVLREEHEQVRGELYKYKVDYQNKLEESNDTNKKLLVELDQLKQMWRKQSDKYESELERSNVIIAEYKQICNTLSGKVEKWSNFKRKYDARAKKLNLCATCVENNRIDEETDMTTSDSVGDVFNAAAAAVASSSATDSSSSSSSSNEDLSQAQEQRLKSSDEKSTSLTAESSEQANKTNNDSLLTKQSSLNKIKRLELELARVKLELVDAQCKNQEFDHKIKSLMNSSSTNGAHNTASVSSSSTNSLSQLARENSLNGASTAAPFDFKSMSSNMSASSSNSSNITIGSNPSGNNWLSKTFTQFKEATNQVVQKAQKVKMPNTANLESNLGNQ